MEKGNFLIGLSLVWIFYSILVMNGSSCSYWIEKFNDGYYIMTESGEDEYKYEEQFEGPLDESSALKWLDTCIKEGESFRRKYGTIFNLNIASGKDKYGYNENFFLAYLSGIIDVIIMLLPFYFYHKRWK